MIELPNSIQNLVALRILKLQNNKISKIPHELAELSTLEDLDCSNNNNLDMVPKAWRGDTESILFICRLHRGKILPQHLYLHFIIISDYIAISDYYIRMDEMARTNEDLAKHSQYLEQQQLVMKV